MTAKQVKPTKPTKKLTPIRAAILKARQDHPDLTVREIAAIAKCSHVNVIETLQRYGMDRKAVEDYRANKAIVWDGLSHRMLSSLTEEDIKKMPGAARVMSAGLGYDKARAEMGLSDDNTRPLVVIQIKGAAEVKGQVIDVTPVDKSSCQPLLGK